MSGPSLDRGDDAWEMIENGCSNESISLVKNSPTSSNGGSTIAVGWFSSVCASELLASLMNKSGRVLDFHQPIVEKSPEA